MRLENGDSITVTKATHPWQPSHSLLSPPPPSSAPWEGGICTLKLQETHTTRRGHSSRCWLSTLKTSLLQAASDSVLTSQKKAVLPLDIISSLDPILLLLLLPPSFFSKLSLAKTTQCHLFYPFPGLQRLFQITNSNYSWLWSSCPSGSIIDHHNGFLVITQT